MITVEIIKPFSAGPHGNMRFEVGQIVPDGRQSWIDKGLAVRVKDDPPEAPKPKQKSAG